MAEARQRLVADESSVARRIAPTLFQRPAGRIKQDQTLCTNSGEAFLYRVHFMRLGGSKVKEIGTFLFNFSNFFYTSNKSSVVFSIIIIPVI